MRVPEQVSLFDDADDKATVPDFQRVMDLQQEQLARSLGNGHRVIHGVAGSGKTMILSYRAEYLAKAATDIHKPVLILQPVSRGRDRPEPIVMDLPSTRVQADRIAELMAMASAYNGCGQAVKTEL